MKKQILLNPGPVNVSSRVRKALLGADICHRESEFRELLIRTRSKLLSIFGIEKSHKVVFLTGSGTAALESMILSFAAKDQKTLVLSNGVYGERIASILRIHNLPHKVLSASCGKFPDMASIDQALSDSSINAVAMVHHETSSGTLNPLKAVSDLAKSHRKYLMVDAISSMGAEDIDFSEIDLCVGVSGKCLHAFPGISFVLVSKEAAEELKTRPRRSLYLDLASMLEYGQKNDTAFTPAVQVLYALDEALAELKKEGLKKRITSYKKKSTLIRQGLKKLDVRALIDDSVSSHVLSAFWTPDGISYTKLHDDLKQKGFVIYAGQSELKDKIFRISNLGDVSISDLEQFLKVIKFVLSGRSLRGKK